MKNIVLTGGGTAGHVMPNIALLPALKGHFDNIFYLGEQDGIEQRIAAEYSIPYFPTPAVKLVRGKILPNIKIPYVLLDGITKAKAVLKKLKPDAVFSKGGYCSLPAVFAAKMLKIPVVCHESDYSIGLANRVSLPFASGFVTSFAETSSKGKHLGIPVRQRIFEGKAHKILSLFRVSRPIILFMGGSLGAKAINDCLEKALSALGDYNILHIRGDSAANIRDNYRAVNFVENIEDYFAASELVVCRAGANTLAELTALGKRVLAIPLPKGASRGDQVENAAYYKKTGQIEVLSQDKLTPYNLFSSIANIISQPKPQPSYDKDTPQKIVDYILTVIENSNPHKNR